MSAGESGDRISIAIAGGGIVGLSIAWRLTQAGYMVAIFDQGQIAREASWAGAGMLAPGGEVDQLTGIGSLAISSRASYRYFIRELEQDSGRSIDFQECGALEVAYSEDDLTTLESRAERQGAFGIRSKRIPHSQVAVFWPRVRSENLFGARFYPDDAIVNPRELTDALHWVCRKQGVIVAEYRRVRAINVLQDGVLVNFENDSSRFDVAIVAAGAWSSQIDVSGVPALPESEPIKGHLIAYQQPEQTCNTILRYGHTYLLQRANGMLIAGSSIERVGFDRKLDPAIEADLARRAGFVLPHLTETSPSESWIGFRPASNELQVGSWHSPRFYRAYGHFRNGILLAPMTAQGIVTEITANWRKP